MNKMISTKLFKSLMKNLQHNNTQENVDPLRGEALFLLRTVEIEFEGGDNQRFKFKLRRGFVCTYKSTNKK